jgi:hypothetical protein
MWEGFSWKHRHYQWVPSSRFWNPVIIFVKQYVLPKRRGKDMLERKEIHEGQPGYYPKNQIRYRVCSSFHDEGLRCTRVMNHAGPHAAHIVMGIKDSTEEIRNEKGELVDIRVKTGMRNTEDVQIATW